MYTQWDLVFRVFGDKRFPRESINLLRVNTLDCPMTVKSCLDEINGFKEVRLNPPGCCKSLRVIVIR